MSNPNLNLNQNLEQDPNNYRKLEEQLHEQYAINNNANAGSLISILSVLLVAFSGYAYIFNEFMEDPYIGNRNVFLVISCAVSGVLLLLYIIAVHLGTGQRLEQFIIYSIRVDYYKSSNEDMRFESIYPKSYNPYCKGYFNFVQGIYNILSYAIFVCHISLIAIFLLWIKLKLSPNCCEESQLAFLLVWSVTLLTMFFYKIKKYCGYLKRQDEYLEKNNHGFQCCKKSWMPYIFPIITVVLSIICLCNLRWNMSQCVSVVIYILLAFSAIYTGFIISKTKE